MHHPKPHIRERAVAVLDEEKVSLLEGAGGLIYRVFNEGIHIIWDMIVEKLSDFKDLVWEAIKSFIQKSIIEAALLHLNNITAKVRDIILRTQKRVEKAIDWVMLKAWSAIGSTVEGALRIKQKGKDMVEKGKGKVREAVGGGGTPQQRLVNAMKDAGNAVNRYAGKKVGGLILKPLLAASKMRYGLVSLDLIPKDGKWSVRGEINPVAVITSDAEIQEGPEGGRATTTIQKIIGYQNGEIVKTTPKYAGTRLREILSNLSNAIINKDEDKINGAISQIRGKDKDYTVYQGAIYAPFVDDQQKAIKDLREQHSEGGYFLSLDRGGSMVGDQIVNETVTSNQAMPREEAGDYRAKQLSDLDDAVAKIMKRKEKEPVRIAISETSVSGGSVSNLVKYLRSLLSNGKYPNLKFKILVLQQTITGLDSKAKSIILRKVASVAGKIEVVISSTPYILGEDVNYQIAKKNDNSHAPVILFKGTEETLTAFSINPIEGSTAREIIIDLVEGKYKGKLPGVL